MIPEHPEKDFYTFVYGYVYFLPTGNGGFEGYQLREIVNEHDRRNTNRDAEVQRILEGKS